jgi:hypothetical protein
MKDEELDTIKRLSRLVALVFIMYVAYTLAFAQVIPITFHLNDVLSTSTTGPWMFENDDIGLQGFPFDKIGGDDNCYTFTPTNPSENYAYRFFLSDGSTTSSCIAENLAFVANTNGFRVEFDAFTLTGFHKINTENPGGMGWNVGGQAGDVREYTGGIGRIYKDNVLVMTVRNCKLDVLTPYPTALQMHDMFHTFYGVHVPWVQEVGTGAAVTADGHGVIDVDPAFTDPQWLAAFANPNGNQVDFLLSTINYVIQGPTGRYDFDLGIRAAQVQHNCLVQQVNLVTPGLVGFDANNLQLDFSMAEAGGANANLNNITVNRIETAPATNLPGMVQQTLPHYWEISTDLNSFTTDLIFDLTGANLGTPESWIVMRRPTGSDWWIMYGNVSILDDHTLRANNVIDFSDWSVGSSDAETLPVELSSFSANLNQGGNITLNWTSQSETGIAGYRVYRSEIAVAEQALCVNSVLIPAHNSSQEFSYSFVDEENTQQGEWYYWLEAIELNGTGELYGPVSIILGSPDGDDTPEPDAPLSVRLTSYPNPFNPETTVSFYLPKSGSAELGIFNIKGELVKRYPSSHYNTGWHRMIWNGTDNNSRPIASGIYYLKLKTPDCALTRKIILNK